MVSPREGELIEVAELMGVGVEISRGVIEEGEPT